MEILQAIGEFFTNIFTSNVARTVFTTSFAFSIIRITTPILFAALAALIANKAGVTNMGLEGIMMISALFGVIFSGMRIGENGLTFHEGGSGIFGLFMAVLIGVLLGLMVGVFALKLKTDIILAGIAVNTLGGGGTVFLMYLVSKDRGYSASIKSAKMPQINIPLLKDIPVIGDIFSGHNLLTYLAFLAVIVIFILLYKTPLGLKIRAVGENPNAARSVGVSVNRISYTALAISGFLAGLGGAFMSMGYLGYFQTSTVAGRGFIGLAAAAMGQNEPVGAMLTSLLFGFANALAINLQGAVKISTQLINSFPYMIVIIGLVVYALSIKAKLNKRRRLHAQEVSESEKAAEKV